MLRLLVPLFLMAIVAVVILGMMLSANRKTQAKRKKEDPREILKRRYAEGEIGEDEYLRRMSGLNQDW
ncbi:SHOCT domain-containing protein [Nonomuraea sp. NPDC050556]|uniref:SHOCT domain-containing protein n=1 Tax=Nonomuraea sp. NPDC050556 TaxID=3364369 RepID=UPI003791BDBA